MRGPELTFLGHSTVRVELAGRTVLTDRDPLAPFEPHVSSHGELGGTPAVPGPDDVPAPV